MDESFKAMTMFGFLYSWFVVQWVLKISCTKTKTLSNLRLLTTSAHELFTKKMYLLNNFKSLPRLWLETWLWLVHSLDKGAKPHGLEVPRGGLGAGQREPVGDRRLSQANPPYTLHIGGGEDEGQPLASEDARHGPLQARIAFQLYIEALMDLPAKMEVFHMLFKRYHTK